MTLGIKGLGELDDKIVAINAAMPSGTSLDLFAKRFPNRCFDVGIAEQHAVTFAAGIACEGMRPVMAIYSTFLQRAYDQLIHDVAIQNLPVLFALDRGGLVGGDGQTHNGAFDYAFLRTVPNMVVMAPADENECRQMLYTGHTLDGPSAVRYPRGTGTGFMWDERGHIVTNFHVIQGASAAQITLADQSTWKAVFVGGFPDRDLAVLRGRERGVPVVLGSLLRIPVGMLTDRLGGRRVFSSLLAFSVLPAVLFGYAEGYWQLVAVGFLLGVAGASFAVGVPFVAGWFASERQGFALGLYGMGNIGTAVAALAAPRQRSGRVLGGFDGG